jgi:hypothetical protein
MTLGSMRELGAKKGPVGAPGGTYKSVRPLLGGALGTVEAPGERAATAEAAKQFHITPARRNKITVTRLDRKSGS